MNINRFHDVTKDDRSKDIRMLELKDKMLLFFSNPIMNTGIDILHLCISLTNDYLYCSKRIKLKYHMPINPEQSVIDRFIYDWNNFYHRERHDESAYRFYCNEFFELTTRILFDKKYTEQEIESQYLTRINQPFQLALF